MSNRKSKKILLIGGNGFLGSYLAQKFSFQGYSVRILDIKSKIINQPNIEEVICDDFDCEEFLNSFLNIDIVYHLMSTTVPSTSNLDCKYDIESNLINTIKLLDVLKKSNCKNIVFISSGGTVYGEKGDVFIDEDQSLNPISSYGIVKVAIENYIKLYSKLYGINYNIFRVSNLYGQNQSKIGSNGIISTLINNIENNTTLKIWGDGEQSKDYIYVSDLVDLLMLSADEIKNEIFNVGSGQSYSINEILEILKDEYSTLPDIEYLEVKDFDVRTVRLNIDKVKKHFNWSPKVDLNQGIQLLVTNGKIK